MNAYPAYRNINLPWLERIPAGWDALPNIALFDERIERGFQDRELLAVTITRGIIHQLELEDNRDGSNEDKWAYKLVCPGDIAYNKMRMWQGAVGHSQFEGIVSPAYIVLKPKRQLNAKFFHYLFRSPVYIKESYRNSYGICDDMLSLRYFDFKRIWSILPPVEEQNGIVAFLEAKERDIQKFIANKRRMVELLKEQKTALINRAITRGLNHQVPLKPSGIACVPLIPRHWAVRRNSALFRERNETGFPDLPILVVSLNTAVTVQDDTGDRPKRLIEDRATYKRAVGGDIAYNMMRMWQGAVGEVPCDGLVSPAYVVARPISSTFSPYFAHLFRTDGYKTEVNRESRGIVTDRNRLYWDDFKQMKSPIPPPDEQRQIVEFIGSESKQTDRATAAIEREIALMEEYRTALIAAAVTGKIQVPSKVLLR